MADVKFIKTTSDRLDTIPIVEGQLIYVTDTKMHYYDSSNIDRGLYPSSVETLATARNISIDGGVTSTPITFDGSKDITLNVTSVDATKLVLGDTDVLILDGNF